MHRGTPTSDSVSPPDLPALAGVLVLCVDDHADTGELVKFILERAGAKVVTALSAQAALEILEQLRPHLLIADIGMTDEDGYEFIRKVRMLPPEQGGHVLAMALTGYAHATYRWRALQSGFQTYMVKPFEPDELVKAVVHLKSQAN